MTRFVVGSVLLALVELIGFATYTATHRIEVGVVAMRPDWGGSYGSSVLIRAPVSRSRSRVPRTHSTSALRDNGARRGIKHADPPFFEGSLAWESSPSLPGGGALIAASTELHGRLGPVQDYLVLGDPVMGWAVRPFLSAGAGCTTLDLNIRYVKPITVATGTIVAPGTVLHHGRRTATAEGRLGAADTGALLAHSPSPLLVRS
jgi:Thioesterase superfamily